MINKINNQKACPPVFSKSELRRGFTLLETLVAISIVTLTIIGPLAMAAQSAKLISVAKNQLIATYLAQEAIEIVRYARDTHMIEAVNNTESDRDYDWLRGYYQLDVDGNPVNFPPTGGSLNLGNCIQGETNSCYINVFGPQFINCVNNVDAHCAVGDSEVNNPSLNKAFLWKHVPADGSVGSGYILNNGFAPIDELVQTTFRRYVQIIPIAVDGEERAAKIIVKIQWKDSYGEKFLYTQENIYKYR